MPAVLTVGTKKISFCVSRLACGMNHSLGTAKGTAKKSYL